MATALLVGQALLCALIGWLTFGATHDPARHASAPVDPLAEAPRVIPPPNVPPPVPPPTSASVTAKATDTFIEPSKPSERSKPSSSRPAPSRSAPPPKPPGVAPPPLPEPATTQAATPAPPTVPGETIDPRVAAPTPAPEIQEPVVASEPCDPAGALGRTADGVVLVCVPDTDGTLRWRVS